jgi:6-phosphofructokinase 1
LLQSEIVRFFKDKGTQISLKYIDPSYMIRSVPANASDSAFSLLLGQNAVHAAMAGRTNMVVGTWMNRYTHVPIAVAVSKRKKIDPDGWMWASVLSTTGQPRNMVNPGPT